MAQVKSMIDDMLKVSVETSQKVETVLSESVRGCRSNIREKMTVCCSEQSVSAAPQHSSPSGSSSATQQAAPVSRSAGMQGKAGGSTAPVAAASTSTYATVTATPASAPEEGWSVANKTKRGKPSSNREGSKASTANRSVVGLHKSSAIKAVRSVKRFSLFVSRLPPGTGAEALQEYAKEQVGASEVVATKLKTRFDSYESYRLDLTNPSVGDVLDPEIWAHGLLVRRFFAKRTDHGPETHEGTGPLVTHETTEPVSTLS